MIDLRNTWWRIATIILMALVVLYLLIDEYRKQDNVDGALYKMLAEYKEDARSGNMTEPGVKTGPTANDLLDKAVTINRKNCSFQRWRQSLLVGLIVALPIGYFLLKQIPTLFEWLLIASIVAFTVYFSYSWIYVHYLLPNTNKIENNLHQLREVIAEQEHTKKTTRTSKKSRKSRS